jgi:DNA-binding LacI/PurR family transcriptional regulator
VHPSTICLALNNSPSIPLATRQRIREAARRLGYRPNAAARNLAFMRGDKTPAASMPLAWINQEPARDHWRSDAVGRTQWEGARRCAAGLGYHLEEFYLHEAGMTAGRLARIIHARGIQGVVFPAAHALDPGVFQPAWDKFACIACNDHRAAEWMDVVCPDYYHNTDRAITELTQRGFERIGLVLAAGFDAATNGLVSSRYLRHASLQAPADPIPVCLVEEEPALRMERIETWYQRHRPDVVLCRDWVLRDALAAAGHDALLVPLDTPDENGVAGMNELPGEVAAAAIARLAEKIRRFEKGLGGGTQCHLIKGRWCETGLAVVEAQAVA